MAVPRPVGLLKNSVVERREQLPLSLAHAPVAFSFRSLPFPTNPELRRKTGEGQRKPRIPTPPPTAPSLPLFMQITVVGFLKL